MYPAPKFTSALGDTFAIGPSRTGFSRRSRATFGLQLEQVVLNAQAPDSCAFCDSSPSPCRGETILLKQGTRELPREFPVTSFEF